MLCGFGRHVVFAMHCKVPSVSFHRRRDYEQKLREKDNRGGSITGSRPWELIRVSKVLLITLS